MAFGWSFPKLMLVLTLGFFLFVLPLLTFGSILGDRRRKESRDE